MANITGTEGVDTLTGTANDDIIKGLGGNDHIISSFGADTIDGGAGYDTIDYSNNAEKIQVSPADSGYFGNSDYFLAKFDAPESPFSLGSFKFDTIANVESIIGNPAKKNVVGYSPTANLKTKNLDVDLLKNRITATDYDGKSRTYSINNFVNFESQANFREDLNRAITVRIAGNDSDNTISTTPGTNTVIGSKGNDSIYTGYFKESGTTTVDYSSLGRAIKYSVAPSFRSGTIDKGAFGKDKIQGDGNANVIGATNKANTFDWTDDGGYSEYGGRNVNFITNTVQTFDPSDPTNATPLIKIGNFVNAIGGKGYDKIVGANKNGNLIGGGGNDIIIGGNKNDRITGTDANARGVGECDTLTGGDGRDKFILGDKNGAYYLGKGNNDFATITDFDLFKDSISIGSLKNYSFALEGINTIDLYSGKDVNTRDLIAKIQISSGISSGNSNSRSIAGSSPNLDSIISKIDILSGSESERDS
jgi:Ca2+-binding RTX toxin-like protein